MYIDEICLKYPRYRRDQLTILQQVLKENPEWIQQALKKCIEEKLYSANEFRDVVSYLEKSNLDPDVPKQEQKITPVTHLDIKVKTRPIDTYTSILGGTVG